MPKIAFEAAVKWFEAVILASCRRLMKTLLLLWFLNVKYYVDMSQSMVTSNTVISIAAAMVLLSVLFCNLK